MRLLILGTGGMANNHVEAFKAIDGVEIVGGVDTRPLQLAAFCDKHQIEHRFPTLDEAIAWGKFDAAANVTPDAAHHATTLALLAAGKHVLCEKPLSTDYAKAREMADAAKAAGVVNMVNLSYRNGAALQRAAEMVSKGMIGPVRHFEAQYLQSWLTQAAWGDWRTEPQWLWRLSSKHGSKGVLGDVGIHILDYATFIAGSFPVSISGRLKTFDKAEGNRIGEYDLDVNDSFVSHVELANGAMGTVTATRFASGHHNDLKLSIYGDLGGLEVRFIQNESKLLACLGAEDMATQTWREIETPAVKNVYRVFIEAIQGKGPMIPDFARGAALQFLLDAAEESDRQKGASVEVKLGA
ncbi:Gfo/Idh/MocA family protein [Rhizobium sp. C4]|uniref:Gfo/Idh/MocA family protein n=1 Tax=Rhizobium sp. C4 TaxID=1349800 RepID=UPI001E3B93EA|nr:Gfo/Idh/MocA family oxidoreductase [Rhizobium sp. C4]MCD2173859.1 Gfo/Idh/MocA family oxidoreductase [Rhizobium sp. C4]